MHGLLPVIVAVFVMFFALGSRRVLEKYTDNKPVFDRTDKALFTFVFVCVIAILPVYAIEFGGTLFGSSMAYWVIGGLIISTCDLVAAFTVLKPERRLSQ